MNRQYYEDMLNKTFLDYCQTKTFLQQPVIINRGKGVYLGDINRKES